jgi:transcriptional regulator with XRE-family HTH domain
MKRTTAPRRGHIAVRLRDLREKVLEFSQVEFCKRADLTVSGYNQFETGSRRLTLDVALRIRDAFGVPLDYLYRGDRSCVPERIARLLPPPSIAD